MWKITLLSFLFLSLTSCRGDDDNPEQIEKLKPVLVEINRTATDPTQSSAVLGESVSLDFHFLAPLDATLSNPRIKTPAANEQAVPFDGLTAGAVTSEDYPGMRHFVVHVEGQIPALAAFGDLQAAITEAGSVPLRYQIAVSDGTRDIDVVGDFPAFVDRSKVESSANFADALITVPAADGAAPSKEFDIAASYSNPRDEGVKISWFVSGGAEVTNRRAQTTTLKLPGAGAYTLVFTVRGQKSRASAIRFRTISL